MKDKPKSDLLWETFNNERWMMGNGERKKNGEMEIIAELKIQ